MSKFKIESGAQLLARLVKKPDVPNFYPVLFNSELKNGGVVELISDINASNLLIDIIAEALLSDKSKEIQVGVLILNTAGKIDFKALVKAIILKLKSEHSIQDNNSDNIEFNINQLLHTKLNNLFLLDIYDATQLNVTLHNLDNMMAQHSNISLIVLDSIAAFYWSEQGLKIMQIDLYLKNLLRIIEKVARDYKVVIIYSRPEYFTSKKEYVDFEKCEVSNGANLKLQLQDSDQNAYQVGVRTADSYYKKYFTLVDNVVKWH